MEFPEDQLEMVAVCSDGLMFRESKAKLNSEVLGNHRFVTIFEPINKNWLNKPVQTDVTKPNDVKSLENNSETDELSKESAFNGSINNIDVYLTLKGHNKTP